MKKNNHHKGFSLIELLVVICFISVMVILILNVSNYNNKLKLINEEKTQASFYAGEAIEAAKLLKWDDLIPGNYSLTLLGTGWSLSPGSQLLDNRYTRNINISYVDRSNFTNGHVYGPIVSSGYSDNDSRKVTVTVDWPSRSGASGHQQLETYLYRWQAERWTQTDWSGGGGQEDWVLNNKFSSKDLGTDVSVAGVSTLLSGFLDWVNGTTTASLNISGGTAVTVNDVFEKDDRAYVVTNSNSPGNELFIFDVSNINSPALLGGYDVGAQVNAVVVSGNYAYLATNRSQRQVLVLKIDTPNNITEAGYFNIGSNVWDIGVGNNIAYAVTDTRLYAVDISNLSQHTSLSNIGIQGTGKVLFLSEDYVYVGAYSNSSRELQVFYVGNPTTLVAMPYYDLSGGSLTPTDIYVRGDRVYISTQNNNNGSEFFVFDSSDPTGLVYLGGYNAGYTVYGFSIVGLYAVLGVNNSSNELTVIDISSPAGINPANSFNLKGSKYGEVSTNYVYALAANCSNVYMGVFNTNYEFAIFSTEEIDCGYADNGTLISSTFDTGSDKVVYNWIAWDGIEPANTDIRFQIATSNDTSAPWNFVGPDGTSSTYYTNSSQEFINYTTHENQRYIRYKLFISSQAGLQVPTLDAVTISYSTYQ